MEYKSGDCVGSASYEKLGGEQKDFADTLVELLKNTHCPLVINIDAPWGAGKTHFLKALEEKIQRDKSDKDAVCMINAWECDHFDEPLQCIYGELSEHLGDDPDYAKAYLAGAAYSIGAGLIKTLSRGVVDIKNIQEESSKISGKNDYPYLKAKRQLKEFKESLRKSLIGKRVVVLVDELDRCSPAFAIKFLERLMHVFDVNGLVFVVATDNAQLEKSVIAQYGQIDARGYLIKFFSLSLRMPRPLFHDVV
ncbi:MAG: hypothetical protein JW942_06900 [Opitutales bacterium]|nr:hypothetical protein [Opitutales bacterium]